MANLDKQTARRGKWGNGAKPLDIPLLASHGLTVVAHLSEQGKVIGETVLATEDVPPEWLAPEAKPTRKCGACMNDLWRPDRGTGLSWVCGRCHP